MTHESRKNISEVILSFNNLNAPWEFETFVLQAGLEEKELIKFKEVWIAATDFENWNYADLNLGKNKTVELLKKKFNLEEDIAIKIANAAGYQWK